MMGLVITIDGPAASGKTSVSRELAKRLGWNWVSTGAFYRGLAFVARETGCDLSSEEQLSKLSSSDRWYVEMGELNTSVFFDGSDVTDAIADESVGLIASKISHFPKVRASLLQGQRKCKDMTQGLVAEGRDCGTVVFPAAEVKIFLTARSEDRASRRAKELGLNIQETINAQRVRDQQDSSRKAAPLQVPESALIVDTSQKNLEQVVEEIEQYVKSKLVSGN
jgi:cytidylate kinase